ncbi:MAG: sensor histidine kinase, partial [Dehalococcoidia bacterium]
AEQTVTLRAQQFAAVTHDLGQPLTTLRVAAHALRRQQSTAPEAEKNLLVADEWTWFDSMINQMVGMIGELLDVSRLEAGRPLDLDLRPTDLIGLIREEVAAQQLRSEQPPIRFETTSVEIIGEWDAARIARVIANLLSNAVKYSPEGGSVKVTVVEDGRDWAIIQVQDEGIGIPPADLPHIFERYQRGANVAGRIAGTGIGLAGARQIVELHGGTIEVESVEGHGSVFTVRLPLV